MSNVQCFRLAGSADLDNRRPIAPGAVGGQDRDGEAVAEGEAEPVSQAQRGVVLPQYCGRFGVFGGYRFED